MQKIKLEEMAGGALQERFAAEFQRVLNNLTDPNTSFKDKREITIKMSFVQNEERNDFAVDCKVTSKLAPPTPVESHFEMGVDIKTGQTHATEYGRKHSQFAGQKVIPEATGWIPTDPETGEVLGGIKILDKNAANG